MKSNILLASTSILAILATSITPATCQSDDDDDHEAFVHHACIFVGPSPGYLSECALPDGCLRFDSASDAQIECSHRERCGGITYSGGAWELRRNNVLVPSSTNEVSLKKECGNQMDRCERSGTCLCNTKRQENCCGDGVCDGPECSATCWRDCHASAKVCPAIVDDFPMGGKEAMHVTGNKMKCQNGICRCRDIIDMNCCGDGICEGPECQDNCPEDCDEDKLCPAEKHEQLRQDMESPIPPEPSINNHEYMKLMQDPESFDDVGYQIDGQDTIFMSIASYRDDLCRSTLENALERATYPRRLFFGVVQQNLASERDCMPTREECEEKPEETLCKHTDQVRIHRVDARLARGPTWARSRCDQLYAGETFVVQVDAHMVFAPDWDVQALNQWNLAENEYAILTSYPTATDRIIDREGNTFVETIPVICAASFQSNDAVIRHDPAVEVKVETILGSKKPLLHPFFAAGMSLGRGHRVLRVPNDRHTPMMFMGEEFGIVARAWTHGYDFYSFAESVMFHIYPWHRQEEPPMFWKENTKPGENMEATRSGRRLRAILGMDPRGEYDDAEMNIYALGSKRSMAKFKAIFGIDVANEVAENDCNLILSGAAHTILTRYIRQDRKGIDYSIVPDSVFDAWKAERARQRAARAAAEKAADLNAPDDVVVNLNDDAETACAGDECAATL